MKRGRFRTRLMAVILSILVLSSYAMPTVSAARERTELTGSAVAPEGGGITAGQVRVDVTCTHETWEWRGDNAFALKVNVSNTNPSRTVDKYKVTITFPYKISLSSNAWERPANSTLEDDGKKLVIDYSKSVNSIAPGGSDGSAATKSIADCVVYIEDASITNLNLNVVIEDVSSTKVVSPHAWSDLNEIRKPYFDDDYQAGDADDEVTTYISWATVQFGRYYSDTKAGSEPIEWRVLDIYPGNKLLLLSEKVLDCRAYGYGDTTWAESSLRNNWLSTDFKNTAFTPTEQGYLGNMLVDNSAGGVASLGGVNTQDKIWIPSVTQMENAAYGFVSRDTRRAKVTDYVRETYSNSIKCSKTTDTYYAGYLLRTPGYYQYDVAGVDSYGKLVKNGWRTYTKTAGVRPMILLDNTKANVQFYGQVNATAKGRYANLVGQSLSKKSLQKLPAVGTTKTLNKVTYTVTKSTAKTKTVAVTSTGKKATKVVIPSIVTINGSKYKVTAIKANAFKKSKKLKTIQIQSTNLNTMNKKAFNGLDEDTTVKIVKSKYKKYKKMIKNTSVTVKKMAK